MASSVLQARVADVVADQQQVLELDQGNQGRKPVVGHRGLRRSRISSSVQAGQAPAGRRWTPVVDGKFKPSRLGRFSRYTRPASPMSVSPRASDVSQARPLTQRSCRRGRPSSKDWRPASGHRATSLAAASSNGNWQKLMESTSCSGTLDDDHAAFLQIRWRPPVRCVALGECSAARPA